MSRLDDAEHDALDARRLPGVQPITSRPKKNPYSDNCSSKVTPRELGTTRLTAREGFREVIQEFLANQKNYGPRAGTSDGDFQTLNVLRERYEEIQKYLYRARKIAEMLEESSAVTDDQLQRLVFGFAQIIEARAKAFGDSEILAKYETVRAYRSAVGLKAAKTRRRNEAELEDPQNDEQPEAPGELPAVETAR